MSRLIFVPQYPTQMRYQKWWYNEFPEQFRKHFDDVVVLGESFVNAYSTEKARRDAGMFSPIQEAINMEMHQVNEFYDMRLYDDDTLFLADLSFPGFFSNVLYHKRVKKMFAFCHATSLNAYDYFAPVRDSKWIIETGHSKLFNSIFVGSVYHYWKLGWSNAIVTRVPKPPFEAYNDKKTIDILSISRPSIQKVNKKLEKKIEREFGKIYRSSSLTWAAYYHLISQSKVVLFSGKEDTFGYGILEAVMNNSTPVAPNKFAYPELLKREYLYNNLDEAIAAVWNGIRFPSRVPEIRCMDAINNFYENIVNIMKQ